MNKTRTALQLLLAILASCSMPERRRRRRGEHGDHGRRRTGEDASTSDRHDPRHLRHHRQRTRGRTFSRTTTSPSVTIEGLAFGPWTVTALAKNAGNTVIGQGTGSVVVHTGVVSPLAITVLPLPGNGTLALAVTWIVADVPTPSIDAQLLPSVGSAIPLAFVMGTGSATFSSSSIAAGDYTLSLKLLDNGVLVMGAVEVVRIVAGQTTSGSFDFTQVNLGTGDIAVTITPAMNAPLAVTMTGQLAALA